MTEKSRQLTTEEELNLDLASLEQQKKAVEELIIANKRGASYGHAANLTALTDWVSEIERLKEEVGNEKRNLKKPK